MMTFSIGACVLSLIVLAASELVSDEQLENLLNIIFFALIIFAGNAIGTINNIMFSVIMIAAESTGILTVHLLCKKKRNKGE